MSNTDPVVTTATGGSVGDPTNPINALGGGGNIDDIVAQLYGYSGWALQIPEVGKVLRDAAAGNWSPDRLKGELEKTNWWKTSSATSRTFQENMATDPASVQAQIAQGANKIRQELQAQGVTLDEGRIQEIASKAIEFGLDDAQTKMMLDSELMRSPDLAKSKVGTDFKALAQQYAVPLSDAAINAWSAHVVSGAQSDEQFREYLSQQAQDRFRDNAPLTKWLQGGGTVSQYFDPYKQYAAQTLGVNPDTIDLTDPKWSAAVNSKQADGTISAMTYDQWVTHLKQDPQYNYSSTTQGIADGFGLATKLKTTMGFE
jgi:hypothetical protein